MPSDLPRLARRVAAAQRSPDNGFPPVAALGRVYPRYGRSYPGVQQTAQDTIDLGVGSYFAAPPEAVEAAREALAHGYTRYLDLPDLRHAIAAKLREDNGVPVDPERELLVVGGARTGIILTCLALIEDGDDVLLIDPDYIGMAHCARLVGGRIVPVPMRTSSTGFRFDPDEIERRITPSTHLLMLSNPNNPTGYLYGVDDLAAVAQIAQRHDLLVFSNELYDSLVYDGRQHTSLAALPGMAERTITVQGVSKVLDMTGFRIGWVVASETLIRHLADLLFVAALALPPSASQFAAAVALAAGVRHRHREEVMALYAENRAATAAALDGYLGVACPQPAAGHFAFANLGSLASDDVLAAESLHQMVGVQTVPGSIWGQNGKGYLRLTLANPPDVQREGLARLRQGLTLLAENRSVTR